MISLPCSGHTLKSGPAVHASACPARRPWPARSAGCTVLLCSTATSWRGQHATQGTDNPDPTVHADTVLQRVVHMGLLLNDCVNTSEGDGGPEEQRAVCTVRPKRLQGHRRLWGWLPSSSRGTEWGMRCPPQVSPASSLGPRPGQAAGLGGLAPAPGHKDVSWGSW